MMAWDALIYSDKTRERTILAERLPNMYEVGQCHWTWLFANIARGSLPRSGETGYRFERRNRKTSQIDVWSPSFGQWVKREEAR